MQACLLKHAGKLHQGPRDKGLAHPPEAEAEAHPQMPCFELNNTKHTPYHAPPVRSIAPSLSMKAQITKKTTHNLYRSLTQSPFILGSKEMRRKTPFFSFRRLAPNDGCAGF